jgi:hypothetical protein
MLGRKETEQLEQFMTVRCGSSCPTIMFSPGWIAFLTLSWLQSEVAEPYCETNGRPGVDPEVTVRLMLAGFCLGSCMTAGAGQSRDPLVRWIRAARGITRSFVADPHSTAMGCWVFSAHS